MRKLVLEKPGKLSLIQVESPVGKDHVRIRIHRCGICGADVKSFAKGHRDLVYPRVLGHEIAGTVQELPEDYKGDLQPGDPVQVYPGVYCGECVYCRTGRENLCDSMEILGFHLDGGMEEFLDIPESLAAKMINPIPKNLSMDQATLAEPLACSIQMQKKMAMGPDKKLLILGAGRLGILQYLLAVKKGWKDVRIREVDPERRDNPVIRDALYVDEDGWRPNQIINCVPTAQALLQAISLCEKGGQIGYFSGLLPEKLEAKALNEIHYKELEIFGAYGCTSEGNRQALELLAGGLVPEEALKRAVLPMEKAGEGIELLASKTLHWAMVDPQNNI